MPTLQQEEPPRPGSWWTYVGDNPKMKGKAFVVCTSDLDEVLAWSDPTTSQSYRGSLNDFFANFVKQHG